MRSRVGDAPGQSPGCRPAGRDNRDGWRLMVLLVLGVTGPGRGRLPPAGGQGEMTTRTARNRTMRATGTARVPDLRR